MAKETDKRKNFWDDEEDDDLKPAKANRNGSGITSVNDSAEIDRRIQEAKVLMEQTHQLYNQFFSGIEKRTPVEKIKLLESKVNELQRTGTTLTAARFKITQFLNQYAQMKDLWDRKLRERERK